MTTVVLMVEEKKGGGGAVTAFSSHIYTPYSFDNTSSGVELSRGGCSLPAHTGTRCGVVVLKI